MAMPTSSTNSGLFVLSLVLLLLLAAQSAESMNVVLLNSMSQEVGVTCGFDGRSGDFGSRSLPQGQSYVFQVGNGGVDFTGLRCSCTFASAGKPNTRLLIFAGTGGTGNQPCQCSGAMCLWSITFGGFSCDQGRFSIGWGN